MESEYYRNTSPQELKSRELFAVPSREFSCDRILMYQCMLENAGFKQEGNRMILQQGRLQYAFKKILTREDGNHLYVRAD
jgi:hypothetical protein